MSQCIDCAAIELLIFIHFLIMKKFNLFAYLMAFATLCFVGCSDGGEENGGGSGSGETASGTTTAQSQTTSTDGFTFSLSAPSDAAKYGYAVVEGSNNPAPPAVDVASGDVSGVHQTGTFSYAASPAGQTVTITDCKAQTAYQVFTAYTTAKGAASEVSVFTVTTGAIELSDITLTLGEVTATTAAVTVTTDPTDAEYVLACLPVDVFDEYTSAELIEAFLSFTEVDDVLNSGGTFTYNELDPETEFVVLAFEVSVSGSTISSLSDTIISENFTTESAGPPSPEYSKWIGTWSVTSTNVVVDPNSEVPAPATFDPAVTYDIVILPNITNTNYEVYGWNTSVWRWDIPVIAEFDSATGGIKMSGFETVYEFEDGDSLFSLAVSLDGDDMFASYGTTPEDDISLIGSIEADGQSATVEGVVFTDEGVEYTTTNTIYMSFDGTYIYFQYNDPAFGWAEEYLGFPGGPFSLSKTSDDTTLPESALEAPLMAPSSASIKSGVKSAAGVSFSSVLKPTTAYRKVTIL